MVNTEEGVFKIVPTTQQYHWGKRGLNSTVAQLGQAQGFNIVEGSPYAELWMGTHPKSPSRLSTDSTTLSSYLASRPNLIGPSVLEKFKEEGTESGNLPFLLKVLSVDEALSIQSHPDKKTAEELHRAQPEIYKDPNHKPEMALAITPFQALCGFRPLHEIASYLNRTPELKSLIPPSILSSFLSLADSGTQEGSAEKTALKNVFASLMTAPDEEIKHQLDALLERYGGGIAQEEDGEIVGLVRMLAAQYPGDVGVFCPFVLNYVRLEPGQAIFLDAGEPHAYIAGDCIECMANSDNVIRAGLTPKLRDVPNLISGLTYNTSPPSSHLVEPKSFSSSSTASTLYDPPISEFSVVQTDLPGKNGQDSEKHRGVGGPSLAIVTEGSGVASWGTDGNLRLGRGDVFFIGADTVVEFGCDEKLTLFRAFVEA